MSKSKTQKYIVVQSGVCLKGIKESDLNSTVELTDEKAACLIGKVVLAKGYNTESKDVETLEKENAKLKKVNAQLTEQLTKLTEQLTPNAKKA